MTEIVTVPERQAREAARRSAAARRVMDAIREFGAAHGGRYHIFGSAASHRMTFNSDFDILVDFPPDRESEAAEFVENACRSASIRSTCISSRPQARGFWTGSAPGRSRCHERFSTGEILAPG